MNDLKQENNALKSENKRLENLWTDSKLEITKLNGSVELAPLVGLSDMIVDLVETGNTLKANGLAEWFGIG